MSEGRTVNTFRNSSIALVYYVVSLLLNFVSRKVFLDKLGSEILGLNTTANNLLAFLNLAELGIGFAISFALYAPIAKGDKKAINEIVSLQGALYKRIAILIIGGAVILSLFFSLIFAKMELPLWYAYASFGVLLYSALLSYFINYRQIILTASQQDYKITLSYKVCPLIKILFQIFVLSYFPHPYIWWLVTEFLFTTIASLWLNIIIKKTHPYLAKSKENFRELRRRYPVIVTKVKQLFFHKIAAFAVTQTSSLIIYGFLSLTVVTLYGNYIILTSGVILLLNAVFNGVSASVGNLIATGDRKRILDVFEELFCFRFFLSSLLSICIYFFASDFIILWIGQEYVLPQSTVLLISLSMYLTISRGVVDTFLNGYGLFKDIWAPVVEAIINIAASIIGGAIWGLDGILGGAILSMIVIIFLWKPYFLFSQGIKYPIRCYVSLYARCLVAGAIMTLIALAIKRIIPINPSSSVIDFITVCGVVTVGISLAGYLTEYVMCRGMRQLTKRIFSFLH